MRGNAHVRFGGAGRGNGPPERATPRPGPTPTRNDSTRNSAAAPTWSGSSPTGPPPSASSAQSSANNTTNGPSPDATCHQNPCSKPREIQPNRLTAHRLPWLRPPPDHGSEHQLAQQGAAGPAAERSTPSSAAKRIAQRAHLILDNRNNASYIAEIEVEVVISYTTPLGVTAPPPPASGPWRPGSSQEAHEPVVLDSAAGVGPRCGGPLSVYEGEERSGAARPTRSRPSAGPVISSSGGWSSSPPEGSGGPGSASSAAARLPRGPVIVGRERVLEILEGEFALARHGEFRVVLLLGDPGVGKMRLAGLAVPGDAGQRSGPRRRDHGDHPARAPAGPGVGEAGRGPGSGHGGLAVGAAASRPRPVPAQRRQLEQCWNQTGAAKTVRARPDEPQSAGAIYWKVDAPYARRGESSPLLFKTPMSAA